MNEECDYAHKDSGGTVLNCDDLVVLTPDVLGYECLRIVMLFFMIAIGDCNICHTLFLPYSVLM
jgi:hypothetical protein